MAQRVTGQRFRQRKLSTKQNLAILREHEVETLADDEAQRHAQRVETGVEKAEETEHHLQAIISASQVQGVGGNVSQLYIPTPETQQSKVQYEKLYPKVFSQPATYIRSGSTVEDCCGCAYTADSRDFAFLNTYNQKNPTSKCSIDSFELLMNSFEETAAKKQPFAAVGDAPVLSLDELKTGFDEEFPDEPRKFADDVYEHWKARRLEKSNRSVMPNLKFETNTETDDADPYVCFRRREARQTRKTRGRDAQAQERLESARRNVEDGRVLAHKLCLAMKFQLQALAEDREIFLQRKKLKDLKRSLGIKGDDEDLINQKPVQKPKPKLDPNMAQRGVPGVGMKTPLPRADGRPADSDLVSLQDQKARRQAQIDHFIDENLTKHQLWNKSYVDNTWRPITPPLEQNSRNSFRQATVQALPTPPPSVEDLDGESNGGAKESLKIDPFIVKYEAPQSPPWQSPVSRPSYRRRTGRGGRTFIDRRGITRALDEDQESLHDLSRRPSILNLPDRSLTTRAGSKRSADGSFDDRLSSKRSLSGSDAQRSFERFKYDMESDEDDELYPVDLHDNSHMRFRVLMEKTSSAMVPPRRAHDGPPPSNHNRSASGQHLAPPPH